ncbi:MAG TPA: AMP-binding protein, partial [Thermoanaerobaculia bacterium]
FPPGLEFAAAFLGCLYAGVVAVPAYPPRAGKRQPRLLSIVDDCKPGFALTTAAIAGRWRSFAQEDAAFAAVKCLVAAERGSGGATDAELPATSPETLAFLQYTSGSTSSPKGVRVHHSHLLAMERVIARVFGQDERSVVVSWLPLYHDMGLIGNLLQPLYSGGQCVLMSPVSFLRRPRRWLEAIGRYQATTSGGPSFAYELCASRVGEAERAGLDLSTWRVAFNGAEPVRAATLDRFARAFASAGFRREAFQPCYGLAEATLLVSGVRGGAGPRVEAVSAEGLERGRVEAASAEGRSAALVGSGSVPEEIAVAIVDPATERRSEPGAIGEVWVAGPTVAGGYWGRETETARDFAARIAGEEQPGPFLRTGDLGIFAGGELFVTGRLKDLIILRGRNHYPQDLERTVEGSAPGLAVGSGAAFAVDVDGEERLVVVQEVEARWRPSEAEIVETTAAIRRTVAVEHEVQVHEVVLVKAGGVPKTSSGKVQRRECRRLYLAGELPVVGRSRLEREAAVVPAGSLSREELLLLPSEERLEAVESALREKAAASLGVRAVELAGDRPLTDLGLDSLAAIELAQGVEAALGLTLPLGWLLEGAGCATLAARLVAGLEEGGAEEVEEGDLEPSSVLSSGERGLWLLDRQTTAPWAGDSAYVLAAAARMSGMVDVRALREAFQRAVDRHEALRTTYRVDAASGEPVRVVAESATVAFVERDASGWSEERLERGIAEAAWAPFDLAKGPLLRVAVFSRLDDGPVLVTAVHHAVADFTSLAVVVRELAVEVQKEKSEEGWRRSVLPAAGGLLRAGGSQSAVLGAGRSGDREWQLEGRDSAEMDRPRSSAGEGVSRGFVPDEENRAGGVPGSAGVLAGSSGAGKAPEYSQFAWRQAARLAGVVGERLWAYWRERLEGLPAGLELPYDRAPEVGAPLAGAAGTVR